MHLQWAVGVLGRKVDVEGEEAVGVRRPGSTHDERLHRVHTVSSDAHEDAAVHVQRQAVSHLLALAHDAFPLLRRNRPLQLRPKVMYHSLALAKGSLAKVHLAHRIFVRGGSARSGGFIEWWLMPSGQQRVEGIVFRRRRRGVGAQALAELREAVELVVSEQPLARDNLLGLDDCAEAKVDVSQKHRRERAYRATAARRLRSVAHAEYHLDELLQQLARVKLVLLGAVHFVLHGACAAELLQQPQGDYSDARGAAPPQ